MSRSSSAVSTDPLIVVTNPDADSSPEALRAFIDELLAGPEPALESIDAAATIRAVRDEAEG